jgi:hypothetical protein
MNLLFCARVDDQRLIVQASLACPHLPKVCVPIKDDVKLIVGRALVKKDSAGM